MVTTDVLSRSAVALTVAHAMIMKVRNVALTDLTRTDGYILSIMPVFLLSYFTCLWIRRLSRYLHYKYDWVEHPVHRLVLQMLTTVIAPTFLLVTATGLLVFHMDGEQPLTNDGVMGMLMIASGFVLAINILLFARYLHWRMKETRRILQRDFPYYSNL